MSKSWTMKHEHYYKYVETCIDLTTYIMWMRYFASWRSGYQLTQQKES